MFPKNFLAKNEARARLHFEQLELERNKVVDLQKRKYIDAKIRVSRPLAIIESNAKR